MRTRTILLLTCAVAASLTPAFLTLSCGSRGAEETAALAQRRAFAAVLSEPLSKARPHAAVNPSGSRRPADLTRAARVKAAQRHFLFGTNAGRWLPKKAEELSLHLSLYQTQQRNWNRYPDSTFAMPGPVLFPGPEDMRRKLDAACADLTQLTPAAREVWIAWEAINWQNYPLREKSSAFLETDNVHATPEHRAAVDFRNRGVALAGPLADQIDYLEDSRDSLSTELQRLKSSGAAGADTAAAETELTEIDGLLKTVRGKFDRINILNLEIRRQWETLQWQGYPGMPGALPAEEDPEAKVPVPPLIKKSENSP